MSPLRLLIVGGGHASLPVLDHARRLAEAEGATVTLVSDRPELWYSGMTPEWLGGVYTQEDVTIPLAPICEREGVRFVQARAVGLDRDARDVVLADGRREPYDVVAFDIGAVNPGRADAETAVWTKPLWRIEALGRFLNEAGAAPRHLVVVGGGAAGTETALNVTARPDLHRLSVTLLEPGQRLCPELPARVGAWATATLRQRGATIRLGTRAEGAEAEGVRLPGEMIPADAVLWATGSVGPPLFRDAGLSVTERGLARVDGGLRSVDDGRVFVAGDSASVAEHEALPRIGVHAVKQGPVLRENVAQALRALGAGQDPGRVPLRPFRPYPVAPLLLSTGEASAWWIVGPAALKSRLLLRLKHAVDRRWIERYRSAATAGSRWDARHAARL